MPELDIYSGPAWMRQPKDQQLSLAEAFQLQQRKKEQDALLPLRQQEMQAQIANAALDHTIKQEQIDYGLKAKAATSQIWSQIAETKWDDPASVSKIYGVMAEKGVVDPSAVRVVEANQRISAVAQAKQRELESRVAVAELKGDVALDVAKLQAGSRENVAGTQAKSREAVAGTQAASRELVAETQAASRETIAAERLKAADERLEKSIKSREIISDHNIQARHELEVLRDFRELRGKNVSESKFINGRVDAYVKKTRVDYPTAVKALKKLYQEQLAPQEPGAPQTGTPDDPIGLLKPRP